MAFDYDDQNIFAKILRGEIPNKTVAESTTPPCRPLCSPPRPPRRRQSSPHTTMSNEIHPNMRSGWIFNNCRNGIE